MNQNPVEDNPVTRYILGMAVLFGMFLGGGAGLAAFDAARIPYGGWIGFLVGAVVVFVGFVVWYRRYDAQFDSE